MADTATTLTPGQRVRVVRESKGLTRADVAEAIGVSSTYIAQIEAGRVPSVSVRRDLAGFLGFDSEVMW